MRACVSVCQRISGMPRYSESASETRGSRAMRSASASVRGGSPTATSPKRDEARPTPPNSTTGPSTASRRMPRRSSRSSEWGIIRSTRTSPARSRCSSSASRVWSVSQLAASSSGVPIERSTRPAALRLPQAGSADLIATGNPISRAAFCASSRVLTSLAGTGRSPSASTSARISQGFRRCRPDSSARAQSTRILVSDSALMRPRFAAGGRRSDSSRRARSASRPKARMASSGERIAMRRESGRASSCRRTAGVPRPEIQEMKTGL